MKKTPGILVLAALSILGSADPARAGGDDPFPDTKAVRQATRVMLQSCKKEFPGEIPGMTINDVDHWAEAQENATEVIATPFKKTQCFAAHETWEKSVQRNEWASNATSPTDRAPASEGSAPSGGQTTGQKMIDGSQPLAWHGNLPAF